MVRRDHSLKIFDLRISCECSRYVPLCWNLYCHPWNHIHQNSKRITTRWPKWIFHDLVLYTLNYSNLNDEIMALNKIILARFDLDFCNSTFFESNRFPIWTWSLKKVHYHVHLIRFYSQRQLSKLILLIYKIIHT